MAEIPDLPHVTDLTVEVSSPGRHAFGAGVANLLARCVNLQRLRVDLVDGMEFRRKHPCLREGCACDEPGELAGREDRAAAPPRGGVRRLRRVLPPGAAAARGRPGPRGDDRGRQRPRARLAREEMAATDEAGENPGVAAASLSGEVGGLLQR
ncbi:uncharacterized protein LOC120652132 [Panicum virgatum]|uniref:uncharacterized protein LOC120652132 n=1 Tax=Panicum virgatum TaxID=38727 RepID=UPI0019D5BBE2|nr:uncharacterized protein LOC120652132 [Panicum virgatum]